MQQQQQTSTKRGGTKTKSASKSASTRATKASVRPPVGAKSKSAIASKNRSEIQSDESVVGLTTSQRRALNLSGTKQGWGADLDPANRPGVPMDKAPFAGVETLYPNIEPQISNVEILKSVEHRKMPPVFGTPCPPKGLSGMLRRMAFKSSEGQLAHWFTLMAADRIDMIEGLIEDLASGHIPNLYKEMGWAAELKHNKTGLAKKALVLAAGVSAVTGVVMLAKQKPERE